MSQTEPLSSSSHITSGDDVTTRKRPPKLSDTKLRSARISFPEVADNLNSIVESLRLKWALLARQFSSRDPTIDSSFPRDLSVDTSDALASDFSSEDLSHEQDPGSSQAVEFRGCAREILDELEALISATNPGAVFPMEEIDTSQGTAELGEEGLQSLIEYYCQQQVSAAGYALECVASCTVDAVITKSMAFLVLESYREQDQCHLRSIMHTIDTTFPKGRVESGELSDQLTSSMVETHVKGRLSYFQKKVDKMHANNSILDWIKGTQASDSQAAPEQRSLISWMITVPSSSSEDEADPLPVYASRIRSAPRGMRGELSEPQSLSGIFAPRLSISDITFSFSRLSASDAGLLMHDEPVLFNRKLSDSSQLSSSYPSDAAELLAGNLEFSMDRTDGDHTKPKVLQEFIQECFYSSENNDDITEEAKESVANVESEPIEKFNAIENEPIEKFNAIENEPITTADTISAQTSEGVKMRQIKGRGILLRQYSSNQLYDDSNIESSISKQMIREQPKPERPHTLPTVPDENQLTAVAQEEEISPQSPGENNPELPVKRRGSRGLLKPSRSFEESARSKGKCVEFLNPTEYVMPHVPEVESVDPDEQAYLQERHEFIMDSQPNRASRKPLLSSFSFDVGDSIPELGTDSVTMATPAQRYKAAPDPNAGDQFEMFEQDWRAFQVSFEADVFSSRHRLRQSNINLNRKLERMHEYASALDECISILPRSTSPETFRELAQTFRSNLNALNSSLQDVVATAQMVGHLSQELKDNNNFRLCFSYVDKLKYRSGIGDPARSDFRMSLPRQESTVSNSSEPALISEDMVQIAIERFISQPAQERQWPSFRKERSQFTAQQSQVAKELKLVIKNYDLVIEKSKNELNWIKLAIKLMLLVLILILLLYLTSESIEQSLYTLLRNLRLR